MTTTTWTPTPHRYHRPTPQWLILAKVSVLCASVSGGLVALRFLWYGFWLATPVEYNEQMDPGLNAASHLAGHALLLGLVSFAALILSIVALVRRRGIVPFVIGAVLSVIPLASIPTLSHQLHVAQTLRWG